MHLFSKCHLRFVGLIKNSTVVEIGAEFVITGVIIIISELFERVRRSIIMVSSVIRQTMTQKKAHCCSHTQDAVRANRN